MKLLPILLLLISTSAFSQSGYYYFTSYGKMAEGNQRGGQNYVSYEFYSDHQPACTAIYRFLDINYPQFNYLLINSGCQITGPFATKEEAKKQRERHVDRLRNGPMSNVTSIVYEDPTEDSRSDASPDPD